MKRLYYLADTIDSTESIAKDLHQSGVTNWNFHVMCKDEDGLVKHQIHGENTLHGLDLVHSGEQLEWSLACASALRLCWKNPSR